MRVCIQIVRLEFRFIDFNKLLRKNYCWVYTPSCNSTKFQSYIRMYKLLKNDVYK